ncbi:hypothetical protein KP509_24G012500 [Ceratopteris richardii]|uniref:Uncharacterized protein n=1 Tax=Ceratopteris richardii TaxID=49495 RepID=A0A8T2RSN5_CERRI|nr:hypothetical protein KP509_24G012500 [Ceratopteris richardii]
MATPESSLKNKFIESFIILLRDLSTLLDQGLQRSSLTSPFICISYTVFSTFYDLQGGYLCTCGGCVRLLATVSASHFRHSILPFSCPPDLRTPSLSVIYALCVSLLTVLTKKLLAKSVSDNFPPFPRNNKPNVCSSSVYIDTHLRPFSSTHPPNQCNQWES